MAIKLSDLFGSMDEAFNNPKLEEMFNKTKDVAENMSKKSAERLEISRKKVELLDAKAKLAKLYEKFGKLNYAKYIGDEISEDEINEYYIFQKEKYLKNKIQYARFLGK